MSNIDIVRAYLDGNRPFVQIGYVGDLMKYRSDGETWEDRNGIKWIRKNGINIKLSKSQGDIIREAIGEKICKCGLNLKWGNKYDNILFNKTGMCQDCLATYETGLMALGLFPLYEQYKLISNELGFLSDFKEKVVETLDYFKNNDTSINILCNSEGHMEKFHGTNSEKIIQEAKEDLKKINVKIKETKKLKSTLKKKLYSKAKEFKFKLYV